MYENLVEVRNRKRVELIKAIKIQSEAWYILYSCFGERQQQEELDLMDSVLWGVRLDMEDSIP